MRFFLASLCSCLFQQLTRHRRFVPSQTERMLLLLLLPLIIARVTIRTDPGKPVLLSSMAAVQATKGTQITSSLPGAVEQSSILRAFKITQKLTFHTSLKRFSSLIYRDQYQQFSSKCAVFKISCEENFTIFRSFELCGNSSSPCAEGEEEKQNLSAVSSWRADPGYLVCLALFSSLPYVQGSNEVAT